MWKCMHWFWKINEIVELRDPKHFRFGLTGSCSDWNIFKAVFHTYLGCHLLHASLAICHSDLWYLVRPGSRVAQLKKRSSISCHITWITYIWMKFWRNQMPKWSCVTFQVSQISKGRKSGRKKSSHWIHVCKVPWKPFLYPSMWWYRICISLQIYHWPCMYHSEKPGRWSPRFSASRQMLRWKPHHDHRGRPENMCVRILRSMCPCLSGLGLDIWCSLVSLKWNTN